MGFGAGRLVMMSLVFAVLAMVLQVSPPPPKQYEVIHLAFVHGRLWGGVVLLVLGLALAVYGKVTDEDSRPLITLGAVLGALANLGLLCLMLPNAR